jgi:hypothetical protein
MSLLFLVACGPPAIDPDARDCVEASPAGEPPATDEEGRALAEVVAGCDWGEGCRLDWLISIEAAECVATANALPGELTTGLYARDAVPLMWVVCSDDYCNGHSDAEDVMASVWVDGYTGAVLGTKTALDYFLEYEDGPVD